MLATFFIQRLQTFFFYFMHVFTFLTFFIFISTFITSMLHASLRPHSENLYSPSLVDTKLKKRKYSIHDNEIYRLNQCTWLTWLSMSVSIVNVYLRKSLFTRNVGENSDITCRKIFKCKL